MPWPGAPPVVGAASARSGHRHHSGDHQTGDQSDQSDWAGTSRHIGAAAGA